MDTLISKNPANGDVLGEVNASSAEDVVEKVKNARDAQKKWGLLSLEERTQFLQKIHDVFQGKNEEIAQLMTNEIGKPITQSRGEVDEGLFYFDWYMRNAKNALKPEVSYEDEKVLNTVYRRPLGVAAVINPWNYPFSIFLWGLVPNLLVGNSVVYKASEECPLLGAELERLIASVGLPDGVFGEVYGDGKVGEFLVNHGIDLICFTGSSAVGKHLYEICGKKFIRSMLEMGGSAPGIVFEDAVIDKVLGSIYGCRFSNCGQRCDALKRLIVHESRFEEVKEKMKNLIMEKKVGNPMDDDTDFGPLVSKKQLKLLEGQVEGSIENGAKAVIGGRRCENLDGCYFEPTLLENVNADMMVWREEVFGPVLPIMTFESEEQAIVMANDTEYGLGAYIFTEDMGRARRVADKIDAGNVSINNVSSWYPSSPFIGAKASGMGCEHGEYGFHELTQLKVVAEEKV